MKHIFHIGAVRNIAFIFQINVLIGLRVEVPAADVGIPVVGVFQRRACQPILHHAVRQCGDLIIPQLFQRFPDIVPAGRLQFRADAHAFGDRDQIDVPAGAQGESKTPGCVRPDQLAGAFVAHIPIDFDLLRLTHAVKLPAPLAQAKVEGICQGIPRIVFVVDGLLAVGRFSDKGNLISLRHALGIHRLPAYIRRSVLLQLDGVIRPQIVGSHFQRLAGSRAFRHGEDIHGIVLHGEHGVEALLLIFPEQQAQTGAGGHHSGRLPRHGQLFPDAGVPGRVGNRAEIRGQGHMIGNHAAACITGVADLLSAIAAGRHIRTGVALWNLPGIPYIPDFPLSAQEGHGQFFAKIHAFRHSLQIDCHILRKQAGIVALGLVVPRQCLRALF